MFIYHPREGRRLSQLMMQGDHLSGKPGNGSVGEFDSFLGIVRIRKKSCRGKLSIVNLTFAGIPMFSGIIV